MESRYNSIELFYSFIWALQRYIRRTFKFIYIKNLSISAELDDVKGLKIMKFTNRPKPYLNYKQRNTLNHRIISLNNAIVNPKTGVTWINGLILEESTIWPISKLLLWEPRPLFCPELNSTSINLPDNGFYHFIIEDLPRFIETFRSCSFDQVVIGSKSKYILDTLRLLEINSYRIKRFPVICKEFILSEKSLGGIFSESDRKELRFFSKKIECSSTDKKFFISRRNKIKGSFDRGLRFESIIVSKLQKFNIETIYLEDYSFVDQISLIKSASVLIGFHGAGLSHMVWSERPIQVFEITENRIIGNFQHVSKICGHNYQLLRASQVAKMSTPQLSKLLNVS